MSGFNKNLIAKIAKVIYDCEEPADEFNYVATYSNEPYEDVAIKILEELANGATTGADPCTLQSVVRSLGVATTIGELKKLIENYPDETSFGFRNQPMQELHEVKYFDVVFVVFQ